MFDKYISQDCRVENVHQTRNYFNEEINRNDLIS